MSNISQLTNAQLDRLIAESLGWRLVEDEEQADIVYWQDPKGERTLLLGIVSDETSHVLPRFSSDLNAMHEVEKTLTRSELTEYAVAIGKLAHDYEHEPDEFCMWEIGDMLLVSPRQRAEAFAKVKGLV